MRFCVTLLKKGNSTQRFSFAKESNKRRNWNDIFVFYSFEKRELVHRDVPLQNRAVWEEIEMIFLCFTLLKKGNSAQGFSFAKEKKMK